MRTCPKCFDMNLPTATACKRCGLTFDQTAVNFARNCPAGRHVMDPTWTVCAFCKAEGLVTEEMGEDMNAFPASHSTPPPPRPRETLFERAGEDGLLADGPGGTHTDGWLHSEEPAGISAVGQPEFASGAASDAASGVSSGFGSGAASGAGRHSRTQFEPPPGSGPGPGPVVPPSTVKETAGGEPQADDWSKVRRTVLDDSPAIPLQGGGKMADASLGGLAASSASARSGTPVRSKTGYGGQGVPQAAAGDQRKIVGILITYTWRPEGQIFPVREGRNWIGRDPNVADIVVEHDETLSAVNSTISFRSQFVIGDKDSMGGTWLNGKPVEVLSHPLPNYSKIRAGSTTWTFIAIEPPAVEPPAPEPAT